MVTKDPVKTKEDVKEKKHSYQSISALLERWKQDKYLSRTEAVRIADDLRALLCMTHFNFSVNDIYCGSDADSSKSAHRRIDLLIDVMVMNDVQLYIIEKAIELCEKNLNNEIALMEASIASLRQKEPTDA